MDKIYLLHHREFTERFETISKRLAEESIDYEVIDSYHPKDIDYEELVKNHLHFDKIKIEQIGDFSYNNFSKKISPGSLSLVLKHMEAWKFQIENDYDNILIVEDDCEIPQNFSEYLNSILQEYKDDSACELLMIGTTPNFISPSFYPNGKSIFYHYLQKTRCTHCYIISKECSQKMLDGFKNINLPIDFKMNEVIQLLKIKVGWVEPGLKQIF